MEVQQEAPPPPPLPCAPTTTAAHVNSEEKALIKQRKREEGRRRAREIAAERKLLQGTGGGNDVGTTGKKTTSTRHGARNQHRHKNLAKWLVDTFPQLKEEAARQRQLELDLRREAADGGEADDGSPSDRRNMAPQPQHVLDVAGGKGELAARLSMCHNLPVVLVDPRKADVPKCFDDLVLPKLPNKWQERIRQKRASDPNFVVDTVNRRVTQLVMPFDDRTVESSDEIGRAVESSSLILGMHADGATEAIVDAALRHGRPFVVVPCCVFPRLFSQRYLDEVDDDGNGTRRVQVRTHDQFCTYLLRKDRRFVMETLPFEGRNVAIWWNGK